MISELPKCPRCGRPLAGVPLGGLCPRCIAATSLRGEFGPELALQPDSTSQAAHESDTPGSNTLFFADYEILDEIGKGGMGVVYRARQISLNRPVALKMIRSGGWASETELKRFQTEAKAAAHLDHPNIVSIYEVGEHDGLHYFSMRLVQGMNLAQKLAELRLAPPGAQLNRPGHPARPTSSEIRERIIEVAQLLAQVAKAIHHAHQRGILHRDLKPSNILIDANGEPHVTDFGLAKILDHDDDQTQTGAFVGTPAYAAPEQLSEKTKQVTAAADVYGLGAILYESLTGRVPFHGKTRSETIRKVEEKEPERPSKINGAVDRDLETICLKCLEKEPGRRYGSAEEFAEDLERWLGNKPVLARPTPPVERFWKWSRRHPEATTVAVVALLALATLFAFFKIERRPWWKKILEPEQPELIERPSEAGSSNSIANGSDKVYHDPKGRFTCRVPVAWQANEILEDPRSRVRFFATGCEISIIARETETLVFDESVRAGIEQTHQQLATEANKRGGKARYLGATWREVNGVKAVQSELLVESPRPERIRMLRFKRDGRDHTITLTVRSVSNFHPALTLFEEFLSNYQTIPPGSTGKVK